MIEWYTELHKLPFKTKEIVNQEDWFKLSKRDKIAALLQPDLWGKSLLLVNCENFRKWIPYLSSRKLHVVFYEKLIGEKGGGTLQEQEEEIAEISSFLGIRLNMSQLRHITKDLHGGGKNIPAWLKGPVERVFCL